MDFVKKSVADYSELMTDVNSLVQWSMTWAMALVGAIAHLLN